MPDEDTPIEEGGLEPAVEAPDVDVEAPEAHAETPVTFTAEQLAEHLPQFGERFLAHHDPSDALRLYGERDRNVQAALTRYTQGAPTDEDVETLRESGYEIPEPAEEEPEQVEPLWGAPWAEPTTYDEIAQLATQDPARAMEFIDKQPEGRIDNGFRQQVLAWWANPEGGNDSVAMTAYLAQFSETRAETRAREAMEQMREEIRAEFGDVRAKHNADSLEALHTKGALMTTRARAEIQDFDQYADGVTTLMEENLAQDPDYASKLFALPVEQQLRHISDLTGVAAWRARSTEAQQAAEEEAKTEAVKAGAAGQRGRTANGSSNTPQSDLKREHMAAIERAVKARTGA